MRYLPGIQKIILIGLVLIPLVGSAQYGKGNHNFREFQSKGYYFGLTFGYNRSNFQLAQSKDFPLNDTFNILTGIAGSGLNVSMLANMKLGDNFDFRFLPGFSFVDRKLYGEKLNSDVTETVDIESVLVQMPFQLRFKSDPFHDMRVYVMGGVKYSYDVATNARIRKEQAQRLILISPHDFSVEIGAGFQFFFPFFIFSPEIKYSQGFGNILIYNGKQQTTHLIEKLLSRTFTISLHFEG